MTDRVLPHSLDAEKVCLGAVLISHEAFDALADMEPTAFFREAHRRIFRSMRDLHAKGIPIDFVTLKDALIHAGDLDEVGGPAYLAALADGVPRLANVPYYRTILEPLALAREGIHLLTKTTTLLYEHPEAIGNGIGERHRQEWDRIVLARTEASITPVEDLQAFLARLDQQPPIGWHMKGLIPDEGSCLWHGQPRDFKSMCAQETALALASGRPAFGLERFAPDRPVKVAYCTEEDPERLFAARMHWLTAKTPAPQPGWFFPLIRQSLSFDSAESRKVILAHLRDTGAEVAVFDPVRSYTGLSDKGPADLRPVTVFLREIQNTTAAKTLLLVHHDTKPLASPPADGSGRSRSQQASGGGIFSVSDCPIAFTKLDWNKVAAYPEDYKLSGNPQPFEVTFETDARHGEHGPQFGSWVRPIGCTKAEHDIAQGQAQTKVLAFLQASPGQWYSTSDVAAGAKVRKAEAGPALKQLNTAGHVDFCTGATAVQLGHNVNAHLWAGKP